MNILFLIYGMNRGGTENQLIGLVDRLDPEKYRCHIVGFKGLTKRPVSLKRAEFHEVAFGGFLRPGLAMTVRELIGYCRTHKIDLIQSFFETENILANMIGVLGGYRNVISVRNLQVDLPRGYRLTQRLAFGRCRAIIANSNAVRERVLEISGVPSEKVHLCYNGVDPARFKSLGRDVEGRSRARQMLGLPGSGFLVVMVANLRDVKNHACLLRAMSLLKGQNRDVSAILVGTGPLRKSLEEESGRLGLNGRIIFRGEVEDPSDILSVMDAGLLTSRHEGFPNALLEYMAAGLPVVSASVGGCREIVEDGETGFLVPDDSPELLADRLRILMDDRNAASRMGEAGRRRVVDTFSFDRVVKFHDDLYRRVTAA